MAKALQSIEFKDKNKAITWLITNHYDQSRIKKVSNKFIYEVRPKTSFQPRTEQISEVGNIKFVYGRYKITPAGKRRDTVRFKEKKKTESAILANALKSYLDKEIPINGSGVQWVKTPFTKTNGWLSY